MKKRDQKKTDKQQETVASTETNSRGNSELPERNTGLKYSVSIFITLIQKAVITIFAFLKRAPDRLLNEGRFRFLTAIWSLVIIFFSVSVLAAQNPFKLLVPGLAFSYPQTAQFDRIEMQALTASGDYVTVNRMTRLADEPEKIIRSLAVIAVRPVDVEEQSPDIATYIFESLPAFGYALLHIWENENRVILNFQETSLKTILDEFIRERRGGQLQAEEHLFRAYFHILAHAVIENVPDVMEVHILIDGKDIDQSSLQMRNIPAVYRP